MKKSIWTLNDDQADINFCGKHMKAQKKKNFQPKLSENTLSEDKANKWAQDDPRRCREQSWSFIMYLFVSTIK